MTESTPIAEDARPQGVTSSPTDADSARSIRWALPILLVLGGLAGAAGSQAIFQVRELFQVVPERLGMPPRPPQIEREVFLDAIANHALGFGALGLLICGGLGLGSGMFGGSPAAALRSLLVGGVLGLLCGAAGGAAAFLIYEALVFVSLDGLFKAMLIHLPNWLLLAGGIAVTAALLRQQRAGVRKLFVSAVVAGLAAALLYPILGLVLFPAASSDRPIPSELGLRLLCFALGGAVLGVAASRWLRSPSAAKS
jgi:hypothetical protein